jgi:hypothetical protein
MEIVEIYIGFTVLMVVTVKNIVFWVVKPCTSERLRLPSASSIII